MTKCAVVLEKLLAELTHSISIEMDGDRCVVVAPSVQPDMASVEFSVAASNGGFRLSDDGETMGTLFINGMMDSVGLKKEMQRIARIHNVHFNGEELYADTPEGELGLAYQNLVNAIQSASFLVYKVTHRPSRKFEEEIEGLLIEHRISYELDKTIQGYAKSHHVPFYLNSTRNAIIETVSATSVSTARSKADRIGFKWTDLQRGGAPGDYTVILDDRQSRSEPIWQDRDVMNVLQKYSTHVIRWNRERAALLDVLQLEE